MRESRTGLWMIGACGSVGSTVALGLAALRKDLTRRSGMITEHPAFAAADLGSVTDLVLGGHDIVEHSFLDSIASLHRQSGLFSSDLISSCADDLRQMQSHVRRGTRWGSSTSPEPDATPGEALRRLTEDLTVFKKEHALDHVVVINIASSEPQVSPDMTGMSLSQLMSALETSSGSRMPTSALYAIAAIEAQCAYVNFTPSTGICLPALLERASEMNIPFMGNDGKTGETLVKSALAPMFAMRNLTVQSWIGNNILGNNDGATLEDPQTRASKLKTKDKTVSKVLGDEALTKVSIDYVPSLDDWKVAWDFIHFEGFLETKMNMQFTWQGSDSALAAPLVLDLARLAARECDNGNGGPMRHLSFFFKDPIEASSYDLSDQWHALMDHVIGDKKMPSTAQK